MTQRVSKWCKDETVQQWTFIDADGNRVVEVKDGHDECNFHRWRLVKTPDHVECCSDDEEREAVACQCCCHYKDKEGEIKGQIDLLEMLDEEFADGQAEHNRGVEPLGRLGESSRWLD